MSKEYPAVYAAFEESPQLRLAVETWQTAILEAGLDSTSDVDLEQIRYFLLDVVRQLILVGFAVVVDGVVDASADVTWDDKEKQWKSISENDEEATLCMFMPPARFPSGSVLSSYGASASRVWEQLNHIEQNMRRRDALNSIRSVFTVVNPNLTPGDALTPSFIASRSNPNAHVDADYTTDIRRHELLRKLAAQTERYRENGTDSQLIAGGGFPIDSTQKRHEENLVTDGLSIGNESRHLHGPVPDMNRMLRGMYHNLFMAAGVPPQKLGMNVNSERLAGSELISSQAIRSFDARVREVRAIINTLLEPLGVTIRPAVPYNILVQHADMFEPDIHRRLLSSTLGIPEEYLVRTTEVSVDETAPMDVIDIRESSPATNEDVGGTI